METYKYSDGGRSKYFKGKKAGDCVTRAISIALELDYKYVYNELAKGMQKATGKKSARHGVYKNVYVKFLKDNGWIWHKAPKFDGRKAYHNDMPSRTVIGRMANHLVAIKNKVVYDTWDSRRKMVYGYWALPQKHDAHVNDYYDVCYLDAHCLID